MTLPLVIVNPASADGATRDVWPKIASDLRTHKEIADALMEKIAELAEQDRKMYASAAGNN
jgi:hypothetical protein